MVRTQCRYRPIAAVTVSDDEWFAIREQIEARRLEFINISRRVLGRHGPLLQQILGRLEEWQWKEFLDKKVPDVSARQTE